MPELDLLLLNHEFDRNNFLFHFHCLDQWLQLCLLRIWHSSHCSWPIPVVDLMRKISLCIVITSYLNQEFPACSFMWAILYIIYLFILGCAWSLLQCGLLSSCGVHASHCSSFSCGAESSHAGFSHRTKWAPWLWCTDLAAQSHVESSWTWDRTGVSCIGKHILFHWVTEEAPVFYRFIIIQIVHILSDLK